MRRFVPVFVVLATWPLLTAGGGFNPPPPGFKITGPAVSAVIVVDPHCRTFRVDESGTATGPCTDIAGAGAVRLQKGTAYAGALFTVSPSARFEQFRFGCVASRTEARFENAELKYYIGDAAVQQLYTQLFGVPLPEGMTPTITDVDSAVCTPNDDTDPTGPGILSFQAVIQFVVPSTRNNPLP